MIVLLFSLLLTSASGCEPLRRFLHNANYTVGNALTRNALTSPPSDSLLYCTSSACCSRDSERVLRHTATDSFVAVAYNILLEDVRVDLLELREQVREEIVGVVASADGSKTAELLARHVIYRDRSVTVDDIVKAKLAHFVSKVYSHTWAPHCFSQLNDTRTETSLRVFKVLSQYQHLLSGIQDGIDFIPVLREFAANHHGRSCQDALVKAGLFEGAGCQMCLPGVVTAPPCHELCMNVAKGCMRPVLCFLEQWQEWIKHQEAATTALFYVSGERRRYVEQLINTFETELAKDMGQFKIYGECSPPETSNKGDSVKRYKSDTLVPPLLVRSRNLFHSRFADSLNELPHRYCARQLGPRRIEGACWNGRDTTGYYKPSSLFNLQDQKCNPEVRAEPLPCETEADDGELECEREQEIPTRPPLTESMSPPGRSSGRGIGGALVVVMGCLLVAFKLY